MDDPIPGFLLATRTCHNGHHLRAFLSHYLSVCEKAVVLLNRRPDESPSNVLETCESFGGRVVVVEDVTEIFHNPKSVESLSRAVAGTPASVVLHLDTDEFIEDLGLIRRAHASISSRKSDYAIGTMVCRFGPAGTLIPDSLQSLHDYRYAAPVRCLFTRKYGLSDKKCFMARHPIVRQHYPDPGWRKHYEDALIEHFRWTNGFLEKSQNKKIHHTEESQRIMDRRDRDVIDRTKQFLWNLHDGFYPASRSIHGFTDYEDVYRLIVDKAPQGSTVVEVGVWKGRSISYLGEYANLVGKKLNIFGYDQFDPKHYLCKRFPISSSDEWIGLVRNTLSLNVPVNTPVVERSHSAECAKRHEDGSVFAMWLDAGHTKADVIGDLTAWIPKIAPGGILAGHDLDHPSHPGVRQGLKALGVPFAQISTSSWIRTR